MKDDLPAFNAWSACYALTHILEGLHHSDQYHLAILDRGLFDALVWFDLLENQDSISKEDREAVHGFLLLERWRSVIDKVFLFKTDPETSMEREHRDRLILSEQGRAMNPTFLSALNDAYDRVQKRYESNFPNLKVIDTSQSQLTTPASTAFQVTTHILELFSKDSE